MFLEILLSSYFAVRGYWYVVCRTVRRPTTVRSYRNCYARMTLGSSSICTVTVTLSNYLPTLYLVLSVSCNKIEFLHTVHYYSDLGGRDPTYDNK